MITSAADHSRLHAIVSKTSAAEMLHLPCVRSIKFYLLLLSNKAPIKHSLVPLIECCSEGVLQLASPCFPPQKAFGSFPLDFPLLQKSSAVANTSL